MMQHRRNRVLLPYRQVRSISEVSTSVHCHRSTHRARRDGCLRFSPVLNYTGFTFPVEEATDG